jgi:hypothetical protein
VDQSRRLEGMSGRLPAHEVPGLSPQLAIDHGQQSVQSRLIASAPGLKQRGDLNLRCRHAGDG